MTAVRCDVGSAAEVAALAEAVAPYGPVRAVMHAGGALQDATIAKQGMKSVRTTFAGKLQVRA